MYRRSPSRAIQTSTSTAGSPPLRRPERRSRLFRRLNGALAAAIAEPKNREQFAAQGWEAIGSSPQELDRWVHDEINVWQTFVRESGLELP